MMNGKDHMDEEKSFEVIQEGKESTFETTPHLVRRGLTEVSAMFDRTGKGYLDETERALRRMDSQDRGFLGIDKVCLIFESLQQEQERSSQLLEALRTESKKSLNLKKGVIALSVFTILLALANVGTSFAVSKLVKDMQASPTGDLTSTSSGERLGTTAKLVSIEMDSLDDERRRRLQQDQFFLCEQMNGNGDVEKTCELQGVMTLNKARALQNNLKDVEVMQLVCNNKRSKLFGGTNLEGTPSKVDMGGTDYVVFPDGSNTNSKYEGMQMVQGNGRSCQAHFQMAIYCPSGLVNGQQQECLVMTSNLPTDDCPTNPVICGPKPTAPSFIN